MVSTVQIVCTGRKIISQLLKIDGSFFVPYFTLISLSDFHEQRPLYCLSVWNGFKDHHAIVFHRVTALLPESECKGKANFYICKLFRRFFAKKSRKN